MKEMGVMFSSFIAQLRKKSVGFRRGPSSEHRGSRIFTCACDSFMAGELKFKTSTPNVSQLALRSGTLKWPYGVSYDVQF